MLVLMVIFEYTCATLLQGAMSFKVWPLLKCCSAVVLI